MAAKDVVSGATTGAATGAAFGPYGALIGGGLGAVGSIIGGMGADDAAQKAKEEFNAKAQQGINTLNAGKAGATAAFDPYASAGKVGSAGELNAVQGRQQAQTAQYNPVTAQGAQEYLDPSANYQIDQSNRAMNSAAIAHGGVGGGLARALGNNAQKMAQTYWTQAQQNQLAAKNQNFNQQDTNYQRNNQFQQDQINNYGNIANRGLNATGANQSLQSTYNQGINSNLLDMGNAGAASSYQKGKVFQDTANTVGNDLGKAAMSTDWSKIFGSNG
jgi:hypothetical protein